jgi:hypothetical protein
MQSSQETQLRRVRVSGSLVRFSFQLLSSSPFPWVSASELLRGSDCTPECFLDAFTLLPVVFRTCPQDDPCTRLCAGKCVRGVGCTETPMRTCAQGGARDLGVENSRGLACGMIPAVACADVRGELGAWRPPRGRACTIVPAHSCVRGDDGYPDAARRP